MASKIAKHTPGDLNRIFYTICGSSAVETAIKIVIAYHKAKGVYLKDHHGRTHIDASSGLFCNPLGHGRKEITNAVTKQLEQLDYVQPFQQGFGGSFELASKIAKQTPGDLNRIFYTICGSSAVETAIKIVIAYHKARGQGQRFRFVGREPVSYTHLTLPTKA